MDTMIVVDMQVGLRNGEPKHDLLGVIVSTPETKCIGGPEQTCITDGWEKAGRG
jgi:hypothetical protein